MKIPLIGNWGLLLNSAWDRGLRLEDTHPHLSCDKQIEAHNLPGNLPIKTVFAYVDSQSHKISEPGFWGLEL